MLSMNTNKLYASQQSRDPWRMDLKGKGTILPNGPRQQIPHQVRRVAHEVETATYQSKADQAYSFSAFGL